ncbi:head completion/stabilization protein [Vreelandella gomseomensis]|uniref:Head completion/stabilization protein n=1 Tax=Vreelandella gomseomensis TaxID=370766 RepID=A0ABU1G929_9GAMM|nr:head completion/stabilization protein [Halomonas gomseomensis]MDR5873792.1 head completion/stabilization protein [Halomonas gomseomensis]
MSDIATTDTGTNETSERALPNNGFWPDIDPGQPPRMHYQVIDGLSKGPLLENALIEAMTPVNSALMPWQAEKEKAGYSALSAVHVPLWQDEDAYHCLYLRALFSTAFAKLLETYPYIDISPLGMERAKAIGGFWRDATWAVSEILERPVRADILTNLE